MKDYTIYLEIDTGQKLRYYISPVMQNDGKVLLRCAEKGMENVTCWYSQKYWQKAILDELVAEAQSMGLY